MEQDVERREEQYNQIIEEQAKPDARKRVDRSYVGPYQAVVHLTLDLPGKWERHCTGFAVAPKAVLTNKHCLEDVLSIVLEPGVNGTYTPLMHKSLYSEDFRVSESDQDYGVIFLSESYPAAHFSLLAFPKNGQAVEMTSAGYPGDKDDATMWENKYHDFVPLKGEGVISGGVSADGQSGSPLFQVEGDRFVAKGILWGGTPCDEEDRCPAKRVTYFVPFTDSVLMEIRGWIAMSE
jgi:V8-like Glu-specific endopeptidase